MVRVFAQDSELPWNLQQEMACIRRRPHSVSVAHFRVCYKGRLFGACETHVEEPPFLLDFVGRRVSIGVHCHAMGEKPLLHPCDEDARELEPLCGVECHHDDIVRIRVVCIHVCDE